MLLKMLEFKDFYYNYKIGRVTRLLTIIIHLKNVMFSGIVKRKVLNYLQNTLIAPALIPGTFHKHFIYNQIYVQESYNKMF